MAAAPAAVATRAVRYGLFAFAILIVGGLTAQAGVAVAGGAQGAPAAGTIGMVVVVLATGVALTRPLLDAGARPGWILIGSGLCLWATGFLLVEVEYGSLDALPVPSARTLLQLGFYALTLAGVRLLGGRLAGTRLLSIPVLVALLGLATLWSWIAFGLIHDGVAGGSTETAVIIVYPLLDLAILASIALAIAARPGRPDPAMYGLLVAFCLIGIGDSLFAIQSIDGSHVHGDGYDITWPLGAAGIALAAWLPSRAGAPIKGEGVKMTVATGAALIAVVVLVVDHFDRQAAPTLLLAVMTLLAGTVYLTSLNRSRAMAEGRAQRAEATRRATADSAPDAVISIDRELRITEWNGVAKELFGFGPPGTADYSLDELVRPADREPLLRSMQELFGRPAGSRPALRLELTAVRSTGKGLPVEISAARTREEPPLVTAYVQDVTARRRREEENVRLAAIVRASNEAMLSFNLDGTVVAWNPAAESLYGYSSREALERPLADLILPDDRSDEWREITEQVRWEGPVTRRTGRTTKTGEQLNVEVRAFPMRDSTGRVMGVSAVERDLSREREREREIRAEQEDRRWRGSVRQALEDGTMAFYAQPVVALGSGAVYHHELLARILTDGEPIGPAVFMPHVEGSELMPELDRWAIRRGFEIAATRPVAVNLSASSLSDRDLIDDVRDSCRASGARPSDVTIEITETAAVENLEAARQLVGNLRDFGCAISLDDFGTGYGSFTYLRHLPVTGLKIDIEFIQRLEASPSDQRVVRAIVDVARHFNMTTVAEGVERPQTLPILRELGIDYAQGFLLGRPSPLGAAATPRVD